MEFEFEPKNFIAGLLAGWTTAFALYQARGIINSMRQSVTQRAETAQKYATRSAEGRYADELIKFCEQNHLAGGTIALSKIVIEPQFIPPAPLAAPPDDDINREPFRVMPQIHDFPQFYAPYNIATATLEELSAGDRAIALLGLPGSGRTTALQTIALWSLGVVEFKPPKDSVQLRLEQEEALLNADDRAERVKERMVLEERVMERFAEEQGDAIHDAPRKSGAPLLQRLLPVYVHLANVEPTADAFGRQIDPAEPLVRAVQSQVSSTTAKVLPRKLYERLNRGGALVLLDGYDDLTEDEQQQRLPWLQAFLREYRKNFIIVAAPAQGYGALTQHGLTPVFLRPWSDVNAHTAATHWATHWADIVKSRRGVARPSDDHVAAAKASMRGYTPFDVALRLRALYSADDPATVKDITRADALHAYLEAAGITDDLLAKATTAATLELNEGFITLSRLQEIALAQLQTTATPLSAPSADDASADAAPPDERKIQAQAAKEQANLITALDRMGLLQRFKDGRYQFKHPLITAYLASLTLQTADARQIAAKALNPRWEWALAYAAAHTPIDAAVQARLEATPDVLHNHLLTLTRWLSYATGKINWRASVMKQLGNLFIAPNQYPLLRERVAAALVCSQDKNALIVFQKAIKNPDPRIRQLACLAIGAMQENSAVDPLMNLLTDPDLEVQIAACLALGAIATDDALEGLAIAITEGDEQIQRAAAEMFATTPEEGYPVLYEAITSEDLGLRRAAVFGLRRVRTAWSVLEIYRIFLQDSQWYAHSAAQQVFLEMQTGAAHPIKGYPQVSAIDWLKDWLETQPEEASVETAEDALLKILQEADPTLQATAALAIGQLGLNTQTRALYQSLRHRDEMVRIAAHRGLAALQAQMTATLPTPV